MKRIDSENILQSIQVPSENSLERFNEAVLRVLCLNQAIEKFQKETNNLFQIRDEILSNL